MPSLKQLIQAGFTTRQGKALLGLGGGASWKVHNWRCNNQFHQMDTSYGYLQNWTTDDGSPLVTPTQAAIDDDGSYSVPIPLPALTAGLWLVNMYRISSGYQGDGTSQDDALGTLGVYNYPYGQIDGVFTRVPTGGLITQSQGVIDVPEDGFLICYGGYQTAASSGVISRVSSFHLSAVRLVAGPPGST